MRNTRILTGPQTHVLVELSRPNRRGWRVRTYPEGGADIVKPDTRWPGFFKQVRRVDPRTVRSLVGLKLLEEITIALCTGGQMFRLRPGAVSRTSAARARGEVRDG